MISIKVPVWGQCQCVRLMAGLSSLTWLSLADETLGLGEAKPALSTHQQGSHTETHIQRRLIGLCIVRQRQHNIGFTKHCL